MSLRTIAFVLVLVVSASALAGAAVRADTPKGGWTATFSIAGQTTDVGLTFDVQGAKVTGAVDSKHTGPGTVTEGEWKNGKLSCVLKFEKHEPIKVWGTITDGKFTGEFAAEGMTGTWTAIRKGH